MSIRTLGLLGIIGSPFMALLLQADGVFENYKASALGGVFSFIYMTGWFCSIIGLYRLQATGHKRIGKVILYIQMLFLTLGEIWNVYSIVQPGAQTKLYWILDMFWPLSNIFMFVTGLAVVFAKRFTGWKRFVTLFAGLWFPITVMLVPAIFGTTSMTAVLTTSIYSIVGWSLLGFAVYLHASEAENRVPASAAIRTLPA
jgi:hypothetical protein